MSPHSIAYHVRTYVDEARRVIGTFYKADYNAPEVLRGKYIFLRLVSTDGDLYMRRTQSNGFSTPVFEKVKSDGAIYMVTQSKESGKLVICHVDAYVREENFRSGLQTHAPLEHCVTIESWPRLTYPKAIPTIEIKDEQPSNREARPHAVQPELPKPTPKQTGFTKRCGCYFVKGIIARACKSHYEMWKHVLNPEDGEAA